MWDPVAERLANDGTVIRLDMYGHGKTPRASSSPALEDFAEQVARVAEAAGIARFDLVGFSMGALVAQSFVRRYSGRVRRLVLMSGVYNRSAAERAAVMRRLTDAEEAGSGALVEAALARWFTPGFLDRNPQVGMAVRERLTSNDPDGFLDAYRVFAQSDRDLCGFESALDGPVLVTTGALDTGSTPAMAQALASMLPNGCARVWSDLAHLAPLQDPDTVAATIREFCSSDGVDRQSV